MNRREVVGLTIRSLMVGAALTGLLHAARAAEAPAKVDPAQGCATGECHADLVSKANLHGPVNLKQCQPCHVPQGDRHQFEKPPAGSALCQICHEAGPPKKVVHSPFGADCMMCHDVHGGENRYFVKGGLGPEGCQRCHTDVRAGLKFVHGPVALGDCLACHTPHQSDYKGLLVDSRATLCVGCHVDVQSAIQGAVSVHDPLKKECAGCHAAHGGANQFFLPAEKQELCRSCHGDFLKTIENLKYTHGPMVEGKACQNCHKPHTSNQQFLLADKSSALCFACHSKPIEGKSGKIPNVQAQIETSKFLHGPVKEGNCAACHQAHGSDNWAILDKPFPKEFYSPFTEHAYDLCFDCHDRTLIERENSPATGFRNGTVNLHYLHVHRDKGRSCRACHAEHGSNQPKHIREEVPFGRWVMKVQFTKTDTGGGCMTGCHMPYNYDREKPVTNVKATPEGGAPAGPPTPTPPEAKPDAQPGEPKGVTS